MDSNPPTWRVFDAPASASETSADTPAGQGSPAAPEPWRRWLQPRVALAIAGAMVLALAALITAVGSLGAGATIDLPSGTAGGGPQESGAMGRVAIVVEVVGAVARPGVYHMAAGSRVGDAIAAAGGFGPRVAADRVDAELNLAAVVHDGDRILVPSRDASGPGSSGRLPSAASSGHPAALIDLNHATREQLDTLPGIGLVTADKIIASRADSPFGSIDELRERGLVGQKTFDKLRSLITVS